MADAIKPGWKSSEWWTTMATILVSLLVALGLVPQADASGVQGHLAAMVAAAFAFVASALAVATYLVTRFKLKARQQETAGSAEGAAPSGAPPIP